jgi:hypothetical protein
MGSKRNNNGILNLRSCKTENQLREHVAYYLGYIGTSIICSGDITKCSPYGMAMAEIQC